MNFPMKWSAACCQLRLSPHRYAILNFRAHIMRVLPPECSICEQAKLTKHPVGFQLGTHLTPDAHWERSCHAPSTPTSWSVRRSKITGLFYQVTLSSAVLPIVTEDAMDYKPPDFGDGINLAYPAVLGANRKLSQTRGLWLRSKFCCSHGAFPRNYYRTQYELRKSSTPSSESVPNEELPRSWQSHENNIKMFQKIIRWK